MSSQAELATRAALGLGAHLLNPPVSLGDIRLFALGRLHLWPAWSRLSEGDRVRIARFLSQRPNELGEDGPLLEHLRREIDAGNDFESVTEDPAGKWDTTYVVVAGRPLVERIDAWLHDLTRLDGRSGLSAVDANGSNDVQLIADRRGYRVPRAHLLGNSKQLLQLSTHRSVPTVQLEAGELRALARRIDSASADGPRFEDVAVRGFLDRFLGRDGRRVDALSAGPTRIAMAPTGSGKSVFARLLGLYLASRGEAVALIVPDVQAVWKECLRLISAAEATGL